jgi:hypothetical protein
VEIDYIVLLRLAPEAGTELANLELLPKPQNRNKSNHIGERQLAPAEKLFAAGLLHEESLEKVRRQTPR